MANFFADKELFPKELWPALEGEAGNDVRKHLDRANEKKAAIMAGMKDKKPDDKHARVLEKLFSVPVDEDAEEVDEDQEQDAGMHILRLLQGQLLISMVQKLTRTSTMSPWVEITTLSNTSIMGRITAKGRAAEGTTIISDDVQQCIAGNYW